MTTNAQLVLCGEAASDRAPGTQNALRLRDRRGPHRNVHLHLADLSRTLATNLPLQLVDLIEIATFVYVADQSTTRGGDGVEEMGADWRRLFQFEVPVRCPDFWRREEVTTALRDALAFLSEDQYEFKFREYKNPATADGYFDFARFDYAFRPERVILFSGGIDSLGGVVQEVVVNGRPVVLVTHRSTNKLITRHRMLQQLIDGRAKGPKPMHVTVGINKAENLNHEYTQRSRSFLYGSLGLLMARMCELDEVSFYENGTISLNLPISRQVVGAKATRTTHPRVLGDFERLFGLICGTSIAVTNHFLWMTKGEVVKSIVDAGCSGMLEWSTSCTHTWEVSNTKPHCGKCSQCIDRRFAILAAGASAFERADTYSVNLLVDPRDEGEPRTMLASYVETAQQVAAMSEMEFFMRYGEVARVVRHLEGSADENARRIFDLYRRHAREVVGVVEAAVKEHAPRIVARSLPESCLLRLVHDPSVGSQLGSAPIPSLPPGSGEPPYFLRQRGEGWQLRFDGHEVQWLKPMIGYAYLLELLRFPGKRFSVPELLTAVHGQRAAIQLGDGGDVADDLARKGYAARLRELEEEMDEAKEFSDLAKMQRIEAEHDRLIIQIKQSGFKRTAKRSGSDLNKIRNSVCNAVHRAIKTIERYESAAGAHLKSSISTGFSVIYQPRDQIAWDL